MKLVIDNLKVEHFKLFEEMAKALNFKIVKTRLTEAEEHAYLYAAMEETKNEPIVSLQEQEEFETWLRSAK